MALSHTEEKFSATLKSMLPSHLHIHLNKPSLAVLQREDKTKIMVLKIPSIVLNDVKAIHAEFMQKMKQLYPDYFIYIVRDELQGLNKAAHKKQHEDWIKDLAFPALVQGRKTEILVDGRIEEAVIERKFYFKDIDMKNREFIFNQLTNRNIKFTMRYY